MIYSPLALTLGGRRQEIDNSNISHHHSIVCGLTYKHQLQLLTLMEESGTHEHTHNHYQVLNRTDMLCVLALYTWNALPTEVARKACLPLTLRAKGMWLLHKPSVLSEGSEDTTGSTTRGRGQNISRCGSIAQATPIEQLQ